MGINNKETRFLLVLAILFFITFAANRTAMMSSPVALGFPLIGTAGITALSGLLCLYVFFVSRKAFFFSKSTRVLALSVAFMLMAFFMIEISIVTIMFRYSGEWLRLGVLDVGALASGATLLFAALRKNSEKNRPAFAKYLLAAVCAWFLLSVFALSGLYPPELHKNMLSLGGLLFILAGLGFGVQYALRENSVVLYYSAGLLFLGNGLFSIAVSETFGDLITWFGLFSAVLGFFLFVAALKSPEKSGKQVLRLPKVYFYEKK